MSDYEERQARYAREQIEREEKRLRLGDEMMKDTPRANRARRFSQLVQHLLQDFLPRDRHCARRIEEHLLEFGFENNAEIISVPPECDALDKLALEQRMLEASIARAMPPQTDELRVALNTAIQHIDHMAAWITKQNAGYSFESLGEDMPGLRTLLSTQLTTCQRPGGDHGQ